MIKPVILITVYRRYKELELTLRKIQENKDNFEKIPDVVIVWAAPEVGHIWFFQKMKEDRLYTKLLTRPKLTGIDGCISTTYPESQNLRLGLNYIKNSYDENKYYALCLTADMNLKTGTLGMIHGYMQENNSEHSNPKAFLFRWNNSCVKGDIWHTNLFAVVLDENYWPPVCSDKEHDVLEHKWGKELSEKSLPGIIKWVNYKNKYFFHGYEHIENAIECFSQKDSCELNLFVRGRKRFWRRIKELFLFWRYYG